MLGQAQKLKLHNLCILFYFSAVLWSPVNIEDEQLERLNSMQVCLLLFFFLTVMFAFIFVLLFNKFVSTIASIINESSHQHI